MPGTIRVLYVDDEPDLLELGKLFLEVSGTMEVDIATSAQESLDSPALFLYDAIISDYQMPGMDGIGFLKQVRNRAGDIPFILFTGRGREEVVIEAINNGADFYLQKGGNPEAQFAELAHKVRQAVARRKSEREITSIFQAVPVGIAVVADRVLLRVNEHLCTMTGYPPDELVGRNTRFLYPDEQDYGAVGRMREQAYREGVPDYVEVKWRKKDETVIDVRITAAPIDRTNPMASMTYCALDITEIKHNENEIRAAYEQLTATEEELRMQYGELAKNEKALRESQGRLRAFMDSTDVIFTVWDNGFKLVDLNKATYAYLPPGTKKEDVTGKPFTVVFPFPQDDERIGKYNQVFQTGAPYASTYKTRNLQTGEIVWYVIRAIRVGDVVAITAVDITQIKRSEEELGSACELIRKSEAEMTSILRAAPVGIGLITNDRVFQRVNDQFCRMTGYTRDEIVGRNARFLYPDEDEYLHAGKFYSHPGEMGAVNPVETRFIRKNGELIDIRLFGTIVDTKNPAAGKVFAALDITEEKRAEQETHALYEKVRESEEKYRLLTEMTNDIIYMMDSKGKVTYISPRIGRYGYSPEEIVGHDFTEFIAPDDLPNVVADYQAMIRTGQPAITRLRLRDKAGLFHLAEDSSAPIQDPFGTTTGIYGVLRDLSGRKET
jgi:PAS domain S-box-containing protein